MNWGGTSERGTLVMAVSLSPRREDRRSAGRYRAAVESSAEQERVAAYAPQPRFDRLIQHGAQPLGIILGTCEPQHRHRFGPPVAPNIHAPVSADPHQMPRLDARDLFVEAAASFVGMQQLPAREPDRIQIATDIGKSQQYARHGGKGEPALATMIVEWARVAMVTRDQQRTVPRVPQREGKVADQTVDRRLAPALIGGKKHVRVASASHVRGRYAERFAKLAAIVETNVGHEGHYPARAEQWLPIETVLRQESQQRSPQRNLSTIPGARLIGTKGAGHLLHPFARRTRSRSTVDMPGPVDRTHDRLLPQAALSPKDDRAFCARRRASSRL